MSARPAAHVAIIMDGNGRWAQARNRPREWGHRRGAEAVRRVVEAAPDLGVTTLTLYAFSSDNWKRPASEVALLMQLFRRYLRKEASALADNGVRMLVVGRRDRLDPEVVTAIERAEKITEGGRRMTLRLAVDYSSRYALLEAMRLAVGGAMVSGETDVAESTEGVEARVGELLGRAMHGQGPSTDVDLLIRSGGEQRLSDFLLWECAYAELYFTPTMWPDFKGEDLAAALRDYGTRERRFGTVALAG
jgi:undecaprenyl diphosphate synthase